MFVQIFYCKCSFKLQFASLVSGLLVTSNVTKTAVLVFVAQFEIKTDVVR